MESGDAIGRLGTFDELQGMGATAEPGNRVLARRAGGNDLTWNAVGASDVEGIQGRYFAPLLVLVIPLLIGTVRLRRSCPAWLLPVAAMVISGTGALVLFESTAWTYYHQPAWQVLPRVVNVLF